MNVKTQDYQKTRKLRPYFIIIERRIKETVRTTETRIMLLIVSQKVKI